MNMGYDVQVTWVQVLAPQTQTPFKVKDILHAIKALFPAVGVFMQEFKKLRWIGQKHPDVFSSIFLL